MKVYKKLLVLAAMSLLVGCYNRFQEYQPYSSFDQRMAESGYKTADMDQGTEGQGPSREFASVDTEFSSYSTAQHFTRGMQDGSEVTFDHSRSSKSSKPKPINIGAL